MDKAILPKPVCAWYNGFKDSSFSPTSWYSNHGYTPGQTLTSSDLLTLMDDLGILEYVNNPACDRNLEGSQYENSYFGWKSDSDDINGPSIDHSVLTCYVSESCSDIDGCLDVATLQRSLNIFAAVDMCNYQLPVGIDKIKFKQDVKRLRMGRVR